MVLFPAAGGNVRRGTRSCILNAEFQGNQSDHNNQWREKIKQLRQDGEY